MEKNILNGGKQIHQLNHTKHRRINTIRWSIRQIDRFKITFRRIASNAESAFREENLVEINDDGVEKLAQMHGIEHYQSPLNLSMSN